MTQPRSAGLAGLALGLLFVLAGCSETPSPAPSSADVSVVDGVVIGCVNFEQGECEAAARHVLDRMPAGEGQPFSMLLHLFGCANVEPCPKTLAFRTGDVIVEFPGDRAPLEFALAGPPDTPVIQGVADRWSGLIQPRSGRAIGPDPFPFRLGHCGLLWEVDFDGSFWVPVGQVDGGASDLINAEPGKIHMLGPNLAVFMGDDGFTAGLQRFPGGKHFQICS